MPTARELLEQADALMRRNRAAAADDIPVLTDTVALPSGVASAAAMPPAFTDVAAPAQRAAEQVPTLTEAVAAAGDESGDSVIQEGEPSDWLHLDHDGPSIIGDAPDSIAIVPQVARASAPAPDADAIASAELEEIEFTTPAEEAFDDEFEPADTYADAGGMPHAPAPADAAVPPAQAREFTEASFAQWASPGGAPTPPVAAHAPVLPVPSPEPVAATADAAVVEFAAAEVAADRVTDAPAQPAEVPEAPGTIVAMTDAGSASDAAPTADDGVAKWDAIAEEIRMQVLQRIDLFTDTGLREQLGMRLKPIVDRASADLVATINLHVGELLRAYVAEAIEREIENWRSNH